VKRSDKREVENLRKLADEAVRLRQSTDELHAKSQRLRDRVEEIRRRMAKAIPKRTGR
jgi:septal ring factor EnvC (AmiA/AmiB activator)